MKMSLWRMLRKAGRFRKIRERGLASLKEEQQRRLDKLVGYARKHAPFYERLYRDLPQQGFRVEDLPSTTKPVLMEHFDETVTDKRLDLEGVRKFAEDASNLGRLYLDTFVVTNTSGTTGLRGYAVQNIFEWETLFALNALKTPSSSTRRANVRRAPRTILSGVRIAVIAGTGVNFITPTAFLIVPPLFKHLSRVELISTLLPVDEMVERLNRFQPDRIHGYPTMLEALAFRQIEGDLKIHPTELSTGSEPLTPRARRIIEQAFGVFVENAYGATETWIIGKECPQGRMHLFVDGCIVEPVDALGRPVSPGERSEKAFFTNLHNFTQPYIRYEMQDAMIPLDDPCPCGSLLPTVRLIGREDDTFYCRASDGTYRAFPPMAMESLMLEVKGYQMFQIRQVERNRIRITFVPAREDDPREVRQRILDHASSYIARHGLGGEVLLEVEPVQEVERIQSSQKSKQIASLVGPPEDLEQKLAYR